MARATEITDGEAARVVFDPIGGPGVDTLAQATANGGVIFLYGMLSGRPTPFPTSAFGRRIAMCGHTSDELRDTPDRGAMKRHIRDHLADGSFKPEIARAFPFAETVEAHRYLESDEQIAKVVVTL